MAKTKGEIVTAALTELGIADFEFDVTTAEGLSGMDRLDSMMFAWSGKGIRVSYNFDGAVDADSGIPNIAEEAVIANLAVRLASSYGKTVPMQVMSTAKQGMQLLLGESAKPIERQLGFVPYGAGHKRTAGAPFIVPSDDNSAEDTGYDDFSDDSALIHVGDIGAVIGVDLANTVNLAAATATSIKYRKPSGDEGTWTGIVNGEIVQYTTVSGDIDESGTWFIQATFELPTWEGSSKVVSLRVGKALTGA